MATSPSSPPAPTVRELADRYVTDLADASTEVATALGTHPGDDRVPDLSPDGRLALDDLARATLAALPAARVVNDDDRRCARLLSERLAARLAVGEAGEAPVHAQWHDVELDAGPYRLRGEMPTLPGFDPGRALARPTGEFVLLRDARIELIGQPDAGEASCLEILVNRYTVDRVRADLMLGFFFPGAHIEVTGHVASDHTDSVLAAVPSATPAPDPGVPPAS